MQYHTTKSLISETILPHSPSHTPSSRGRWRDEKNPGVKKRNKITAPEKNIHKKSCHPSTPIHLRNKFLSFFPASFSCILAVMNFISLKLMARESLQHAHFSGRLWPVKKGALFLPIRNGRATTFSFNFNFLEEWLMPSE